MNDSTNAKQQIVDKIKASSNILVTVGVDPSVDELASALGLTIMLNNLGKHATAVASGQIPAAISFLDPEKTFENTVDSLRDFIIALDKSKADHLRYKVEGDVVKIFITPYRATITQDDLDFSQGDYNVELVLALGVKDKDHLDKALSAHGRILHDATVASLSAGTEESKLGNLDWHESGASSISEMLTSMSEALKGDKPILDEQIATAFLTGIVATTDRFSNDKTSSKVMTMAAQLMAAGANQQLIAAKLQENDAISDDTDTPSEHADGTHDLSEGESTKLDKAAEETEEKADEPVDDKGSLAISHEKDGKLEEVAEQTAAEQQDEAAEKAEEALAEQLEAVAPVAVADTPTLDDLKSDIAAANADVEEAAEETPATALQPAETPELAMPDYEPTMGGTLNATTEQAAEDKRREEADSRNKTILNHGGSGTLTSDKESSGFTDVPFSASTQPADAAPPEALSGSVAPPLDPIHTDVAPQETALPPVTPTETLAEIDAKNRSNEHADAQAAVAAAFDAAPFDPANHPIEAIGAQPLDVSAVIDQPTVQPAASAPGALPPLPDFSTLPPPPPLPGGMTMPPEQLGQVFGPTPATPTPASQPVDPSQFKIPGQS